jgi:hypothetical protein
MALKITKDSHVDHGLTSEVLDHIKERFADRDAFFIETFQLPVELGKVFCGLYGPLMGDDPVPEDIVYYGIRDGRKVATRMIQAPYRMVRTLTVIAGPHGEDSCVLYTAFGGALTEREPGDPDIKSLEDLEKSRKCWAEHALADPCGDCDCRNPGIQSAVDMED